MRANFVMSGVSDGLRRNLLMTIALVLTTAVSLSFVAAAILTGTEINRFEAKYKEKLVVQVYLCQSNSAVSAVANGCSGSVTDAQVASLRAEFQADPTVT